MQKEIYGVEGVEHLFTEEKLKGVARLSKFNFDESNPHSRMYNLRMVRDNGFSFRVHTGDYVRLHVNGELMMTDTGMERISNKPFMDAAHGTVMVAGLGVGLVLNTILKKESVNRVVVVEKYQDVIDLVGPVFRNEKLEIVCADINEYATEEKFDVIYFDIWPEIGTQNLPEIKALHKKFRRNLNKPNPKKWIGIWMHDHIKKIAAREKRAEAAYRLFSPNHRIKNPII